VPVESQPLRESGGGGLVQPERVGELSGLPEGCLGRVRLQHGDEPTVGRGERWTVILGEVGDEHALDDKRNFTCSERKWCEFTCSSSTCLRANTVRHEALLAERALRRPE